MKGALWKQKKKTELSWLFTMDQQLLPFWMDFDELRKKNVSFQNHLSSKAREKKKKEPFSLVPGEIIQTF